MKTELHNALRTLAQMAEEHPPIIMDLAWQKASEGLGNLVKREDAGQLFFRRPKSMFRNNKAARRIKRQMAKESK